MVGGRGAPSSHQDVSVGILRCLHVCKHSYISSISVGLFIERRTALPMEFNVPRFLSSLDLPLSDPAAPHPALLDAACLMGCFFDRGAYRKHQGHFLTRARASMQKSLAMADRLIDFVRASCIVSLWYCFNSPLKPIAASQITCMSLFNLS
jgi:hypothetical protein